MRTAARTAERLGGKEGGEGGGEREENPKEREGGTTDGGGERGEKRRVDARRTTGVEKISKNERTELREKAPWEK